MNDRTMKSSHYSFHHCWKRRSGFGYCCHCYHCWTVPKRTEKPKDYFALKGWASPPDSDETRVVKVSRSGVEVFGWNTLNSNAKGQSRFAERLAARTGKLFQHD